MNEETDHQTDERTGGAASGTADGTGHNSTADGTGHSGAADGTGHSGAGDSEEAAQKRRAAAWRGAERVLVRGGSDRTMAERLAALASGGAAVHDLDAPVDIYGDGVVAALERRVAGLLGFDDAVFFPTGTMAQQVALRCWAGRTGNPVVALHPLAHPEQHERDALSALSGLRTVHPTQAPRLPTADEVRGLDEPFGTLMLELPLRDAGFVLPTWDELVEVVEAAREREAVVHFDGARLWECAPHFGRPLDEVAGLADSVYVSLYKSLEGLSGALLAGPSGLADEARAWRHRYGGTLFQQFPAALAGLVGIERVLPRLPLYVSHAKEVAAAIAAGFAEGGVPWFRVHPEVPHTHQFQVWLPYGPEALTGAAVRQAEETGTALFRRWYDAGAWGPPGVSVTEVTVGEAGTAWTPDDVREAVRGFLARVG
ncbi:threonine aldolase family protein [Streptomyces sp. NPDC050504]|uniref:threonine aldolase family protein n=1 Tax=Streptomyces sp. NPDC050504 TaxID=3365618 RepID=UPI00378B483E